MKKFLILMIGLLSASLWAQTAVKTSIDSGGGVVVAPNFTVIHTLGEVVVAEKTDGTLHVSEGFISAELVTTLGVEDYTAWNTVKMYPNPATEFVHINFAEVGTYEIVLYQNNGSLIKSINTNSESSQTVDLRNIASGNYFIVVKDPMMKRYQSFKLIVE